MADTEDYLTIYRRFFEEFAKTVEPDDQLPVTVGGYHLCDSEIVGEIVDWTLQYLNLKHCPSSLVAPLTRIVVDEIKCACKKHPLTYGYRPAENIYQPLKLMQAVTGKVIEVCLRYCDNGKLATLPRPSPGPPISSCAIKNTRRRMEDRHVIIEDFHTMFNVQDRSPTSYYAVFDGHAGTDAAVYSVSHLHQFLAESSFYPTDPERALKDAFSRTDTLFLEKSNKENLRSGTTAVCALLRPKEKTLYVAWLGDSLALLVRNGHVVRVVNPHKPDRQDERDRIEEMGGYVLFWGTWRVNGQLAVSRAIGDLGYKPYVTSEPDVKAVTLDGTEDFLVLACDGLWDFVSEEDAVMAVYEQISEAPGDIEGVSQRLVQLSKKQGSTDNISVIVVFLTEPIQLASRPIPQWANNSPPQQEARAMETNFDHNTNSTSAGSNPFLTNPTSDAVPFQKGGLLLDLGGGDSGQVYRHNGASPSATDLYFLERTKNGKNSAGIDNYEDDDDDFGPETDVDAIDDVLLSPTSAKTATLNNNPFDSDEQRALEADLELQRQQLSEFDPVREPREETPTPPADEVPAVTTAVPESENVGESGEDSEDEWNYYRVEPTTEGKQQAAQPICRVPAQPQLEGESNMESQLNPDAAEFVPSPTQMVASTEEILLAQSPSKGIAMEDICVPSQSEFQLEVSHRPGELDLASESPLVPESKLTSKLPDLINSEGGNNVNPFITSCNLEDEGVLDKTLEKGEKNEILLEESSNVQESTLDESEVTSTKAEYGDDSSGFITLGLELQNSVTQCVSSCSAVDNSFTDLNLLEAEFAPSVAQSNNSSLFSDSDLSKFNDDNACINKSTIEESVVHEEEDILLDNTVPMCFEVQKDLVPEMELKPERVQLESEGASSFEDSGSPLQAEDKQLELDESAIISQVPHSPIPDLHSPVPEENDVTSHMQEPSLQDLLVTDTSAPAEPAVSLVELETAAAKPSQSPTNTHTPEYLLWGSTSPMPTLPPEQDSVRQEAQSVLPNSYGETSLHEQIKASPELLFSDVFQQPAVVEREGETGKCHEVDVNSVLLDTVGNVQLVDTSDLRKLVQQDVSTVVPSSLLEQSPLLRDSENEISPGYDSVLTDVAREKDRDFPSGVTDLNVPVIDPVNSEMKEIVEIPGQAPTDVSEDLLQLSNVESPTVPAEPTDLSEKVDDTAGEGVLVTAAAAATVATAVAAGAIVGHEEKLATEAKAPEKKAATKSTATVDKKEQSAVKTKVSKTTVNNKTATATTAGKVLQKLKPTSPTKPTSTTTLRSTTPKKSSTAASSQPLSKPPSTTTIRSSAPKRPSTGGPLPPAGRTTKPPVTADKAKPGVTSPTKSSSSAAMKSTSLSTQPRPGATNKSSILSNGDLTKPAITKKAAVSTAAKPQSRPATAPVTARNATTKQTAAVTSRTTPMSSTPPRPKPRAVNIGVSKSGEAGTVPTEAAGNKIGPINDAKLVTEKQVKQTANKQISSHIITSKTSTTVGARRVPGVTKTTITSSTSKVGLKKTSSSTTNSGTRASSTASTKAAKTEVTLVTSNNEIVQVQQVD